MFIRIGGVWRGTFFLNRFKVDERTVHSCIHSVSPISWIGDWDEEREVLERVIPFGLTRDYENKKISIPKI